MINSYSYTFYCTMVHFLQMENTMAGLLRGNNIHIHSDQNTGNETEYCLLLSSVQLMTSESIRGMITFIL